MLRFGCPFGHALFKRMFRKSKANQLVVCDVLAGLRINLPPLEVVIGVLLFLAPLPVSAVLTRRLVQGNIGACLAHL